MPRLADPGSDTMMRGMDEMYERGGGPPRRPGKDGESVDEENAEQNTALIPKSVLGGKDFKEGEEVVMKIVKDHGEEVEVAYADERPGGEGEGQPGEEESGAAELDRMDSQEKGY